jgi:hypothetical protein
MIPDHLSFAILADKGQSGDRTGDFAYVPEQRIARFVNVISILMAVVLLFIAIISLYVVTQPKVKLGLIGIYMILFACSVGIFTTAKRSEIFATTAA